MEEMKNVFLNVLWKISKIDQLTQSRVTINPDRILMMI